MQKQDYIPKAFFEKYKDLFKEGEFKIFKNSCYKSLRKSIRVNTLKISVEDFKIRAEELGWELLPIPWCETGFWIERDDRSISLGKSYLHIAGYFYVQEASSMIPPEILNPQPGEKILDMSAAPGSKTTQLAAKMQNTGIIVANEPETSRIKAMSSNVERLGVVNYLITQKDGRAFSQYFPNYFDKVLIDAPCGGEGTIRKDRTALEHWNEKYVQSFSTLQKTLLTEAFHSLKAGGELIYSTCTLSPEENEEVVLYLLENYPEEAELIPIKESWTKPVEKNIFGLNGVVRVWPHTFDTEGFFIAKIKKLKETSSDYYEGIKPWKRKSPFQKISKKQLLGLSQELERFGTSLEKHPELKNALWQRNEEIWIRPEKCEEILSKMSSHGAGIQIGHFIHAKFDWTHNGLLFFEKSLKSRVLNLEKEDLVKFLKGQDLPNKTRFKEGNILISFKGVGVGFCKIVGVRLKNKLPRHFVYH